MLVREVRLLWLMCRSERMTDPWLDLSYHGTSVPKLTSGHQDSGSLLTSHMHHNLDNLPRFPYTKEMVKSEKGCSSGLSGSELDSTPKLIKARSGMTVHVCAVGDMARITGATDTELQVQ